MKKVCAILVPHSTIAGANLTPDSPEWNQLTDSFARTITEGWSDDNLSEYRFVMLDLDDSYTRESDEYVVLTVTYKNLGLTPSGVARGKDFDSGTFPVAFGDRFLFIVIRHDLPEDFELTTEPTRLDELWAERQTG